MNGWVANSLSNWVDKLLDEEMKEQTAIQLIDNLALLIDKQNL